MTDTKAVEVSQRHGGTEGVPVLGSSTTATEPHQGLRAGFVIGAGSSGAGKTSVSLGLARALARRGLAVQTFKVGPDYLDPTHLAAASGRPCYNLDGWMMGADHVRDLFVRETTSAAVALVEGVMGLYDGASPVGEEGSTAEIARLLGLPVLLVLDAHAQARTFAAAVHGLITFPPGICCCGVIANRVGSDRHAQILREALAAAGLPPLLGAIRQGALPELPSRHLGLVASDADAAHLDALAEAVTSAVDVDGLLRRAARGPEACAGVSRPVLPTSSGLRLGLARDAAFSFYYQDCLDALAAAGVEIVPFSPIADVALPPDLHGLYLGGGYPEAHATALAANQALRAQIAAFAAGGGMVYAECGGLMYLCRSLRDGEGREHPMCGVLPAACEMLPRRQRLGLVEAELLADGILGQAGTVLRGHEFHYSRLVSQPLPAPWRPAHRLRYRDSTQVEEGFAAGRILASYAHLHLASRPAACGALVATLQGARTR